ncbi:hypothetical protein [Pseudofrankia sp. BMG5.37]|uniref:hypothetical protein n=1 Tax=Pseudofrankia sp. BMG5.37 TaxID=3050035 RepID=UPI002895947C|nr:hypothetical protein [Pseudofrankia sp. BMG5.37]MDT3438337.1 hypothetical protein [Pseudofrankia sp. BMG5.37]
MSTSSVPVPAADPLARAGAALRAMENDDRPDYLAGQDDAVGWLQGQLERLYSPEPPTRDEFTAWLAPRGQEYREAVGDLFGILAQLLAELRAAIPGGAR